MNKASATSHAVERLPDFIIGGAMKSATTTIHSLLSHHPEVFIPKGEVLYFDVDEIAARPDNFSKINNEWLFPEYDSPQMSDWYRSHFAEAKEHQLVGEDSPTYLASEKAPQRIRNTLPDVKLIFTLRDPVERAYSHYWHYVRTGRVFFNFDDTIRYSPGNIIQRGFYRVQLERYLELFDASQIKIIIFESFIRDPAQHLTSICDFLNINHEVLDFTESHFNPGKVPRWLSPQLMINRYLRRYAGRNQIERLPLQFKGVEETLWTKFLRRVHRTINPWSLQKPPKMASNTRRFLTRLYSKENRGLSELVGVDLSKHWNSIE
ncbi:MULTISPECIES: sulfotransferase family protein [Pirellulaceae]|nr:MULTISPECIES: sulfotransferase [Pirellulaceae]